MSRVHACEQSEVLEAARVMLQEVGYDSFNMRALADHCHLAVGTLYNYFPSKYKIVYEIMLNDWNALIRDADAIAARREDPLLRLGEMYRRIQVMFDSAHQLWSKGHSSVFMEGNVGGAHHRQESFRSELAQRVVQICAGACPACRDAENAARTEALADGMVRLMFSYCSDGAGGDGAVYELIAAIHQSILGGKQA